MWKPSEDQCLTDNNKMSGYDARLLTTKNPSSTPTFLSSRFSSHEIKQLSHFWSLCMEMRSTCTGNIFFCYRSHQATKQLATRTLNLLAMCEEEGAGCSLPGTWCQVPTRLRLPATSRLLSSSLVLLNLFTKVRSADIFGNHLLSATSCRHRYVT